MSLIEQITQEYEKDQKSEAVAVTLDDIPLSYESITAEWLTKVMCRDHPGAEVVSIDLGPPDTGSSNRRRIALQYNEAGERAGLQRTLFCKASHDLPNRVVLATSGGLISEVTFYNRIRSLLEIEAPECFLANYDSQSFNSIIILADLTDEVETFCSHRTPINKARVMSQMELLATLHAKFYNATANNESLAPLATWPEYFEKTLNFGMKDGSNRGFLAAEEVIPARLYRRYEEIWPATIASVAEHKELPNTFTHNDVHLKNWYVLPGDRMGLSDWQCCAIGHGSRDLAYTIATALTVEDRRAWEEELVRYYVDQLAAHGIDGVTFDDTWRLYRRQLLSALTWWTVTLTPPEGLPDMQPRDITLEFIRRITTAIDDLDAMKLF